jgi:hypothetical protein
MLSIETEFKGPEQLQVEARLSKRILIKFDDRTVVTVFVWAHTHASRRPPRLGNIAFPASIHVH